jgi:hypothetical protein
MKYENNGSFNKQDPTNDTVLDHLNLERRSL